MNNRIRYCPIYHVVQKKGQEKSIGGKINKRNIKVTHANVDSSRYEEEVTGDRPRKFKVGSNSFLIGVDNHASTCMANNINHFMGLLKNINNRVVKGCAEVIYIRG